MFKLESYITPILLSYVNRYINNFKLEDSQVSLWGGDASFHNLELNLQVLEQELQLPFSFVSGSIRELLIHVPWTKLASEPITITINTIECILNLKGRDGATRPENLQIKEKMKKPTSHGKEIEAPQGYVQLLINKIVSNIRIYCNNVILKYVEEDIVLSMNVKLLKFESANSKWESAYTDLSPAEVILRKVITVNDLTLCLDKRNASGKIEIYQEPMLYRCSMTMHLLKHYHSATASRASTTRLDIYCNNMEFSMTEQQVPMLMRLLMLLYALQQRQLKPERDTSVESSNVSPDSRENQENAESWTGWAWSYVSSVLPAPWDEEWNDEQLEHHKGHSLHFGFYVDNLSITFKVSEASFERSSYYAHKKLRYTPMLCLKLQGIYSETLIHGLKWFNSAGGVSEAVLLPIGVCSCSHTEILDDINPVHYLKIGSETSSHKTDSLFDAEAIENKGKRRQYNTSWDYHMTVFTESVLLERTPAFAFDYLYHMEVPSDVSSDKLSDMGSNYEFSNLSERSCIRNCFGPFKLRLCSGFFHRMSSLQVAASYYDYQPYYTLKPDLPLQDLLPPSEEDFDALSEFIPSRSMRITFFAPIIELELMDHPFFQPSKETLFRKKKKISSSTPKKTMVDLPKLTIECQFLDISISYPMYVNRLVHTTCQLPEPPKKLFNACFSKQDIKILGVCSRLVLSSQRHTTILTPSSLSYSCRSILKPQYWTNPDIPHIETTFESESITLNGTNAKMMVIVYIIGKLMKMDSEGAVNTMTNTSILSDASIDHGLPYMELCIEGIRFKRVITNSTVSMDVSLGSIKAFIFEPVDVTNPSKSSSKDIQQVLFVSGPEPKNTSNVESKAKTIPEEQPLFTACLQYPINPDVQKHPPILLFNLQEIRICVDPLLCRWLLYAPKQFGPIVDYIDSSYHKTRNVSEASGSAAETPRRLSSQLESVHSSSDREQLFMYKKVQVVKEDPIDLQEKVYNVLKKWFDVWKGMFLCGDVSQCTIYFPLVSLSAVGSQGIQEAVEAAVNKEHPPDIMVITLPFANIRSAHRQIITKHLKTLPVTLPDSIWSPNKSSFPWTISISDLSCYTIQYGNKLIFLKPVSLSATVGLSTRPAKVENEGLTASPKMDIAYLGVCVHIDMTPILVSTSEVQVYLFASILYGLLEVTTNLMPEKSKTVSKTQDVLPPALKKNSSTISPTIIRENTLDSISEKTPPINLIQKDSVDDSVKLTAWVQWTITRFTVELLSSEYKSKPEEELESLQPRLKLVVDAEDIVSSLDFQSIYLKIKSKIGSMSIQHYKRSSPNSKWKPGPFLGIVMRLQEDAGSSQHHEDHGFINVTITRASCQHTHTLWGAVQKHHKHQKKSEVPNPQLLSQSRYITEIVVNIQPIDFVISLSTLRSFYLVVVPLLQIPINEEPKTSNSVTMLNFNNQNLPLAYLECQDIRVIMPSVELGNSGAMHDVVVFQVQKICLSPSAVNPICRSPVRPDIYEQAGHARILNVPGSEVEDRQYQLDLVGISICTGTWDDIVSMFSPLGNASSSLRGMSENPAVEWNNLEHGQPNINPVLNLWNVTEKFDISTIVAPAMVYKETNVVCGHSIEVNFVSDILVNLSLHQIKLVSALYGELVMLIEPPILDKSSMKRPTVKFPYSRFDLTPFEMAETEPLELLRDSGIETSDMKSLMSSKFKKTRIESEKHAFPKLMSPLPQTSATVPFEVLVTAGKIGLAVYQMNDTTNTAFVLLPKQRGKKKKIPRVAKDDLGYEAEEESHDDKSESHKKYIPLFYFCVRQPNAFISMQQLARRVNISCFDLNLKLSGPEYSPVAHIPTEDDFPVSVLQTRSGVPDPNTGILPAFFTIMFSKGIGKNATLDIEISKPTKILFSASMWSYLLNVKDKVMDAFKGIQKSHNLLVESVATTAISPIIISPIQYTRCKVGDTYCKFQEIKDILRGTNNINLKLNQIILSVKSDSGHEVNLGIDKLTSFLILSSRPEKLSVNTKLNCLTLTVVNENYRKLLLNPWTFSIDVSVFWESWQSLDSNPQIQLSSESDCISLDVSPEQIKCVEMVIKDINEFTSSLPFRKENGEELLLDSIQRKGSDKDQQYKDDLRAGAFQFVDANTENSDEQPLPYQVMFWNNNISAMAWRYPQPRALTKVRIFPVPYKITMDFDENLQVLCYLEYWSECRNCYLPFTQFYLSESEVCHLTLPEGSPQPVVAATWRVVITMVNDKEDLSKSNNMLISPRALAACMRIDSYFNKTLIPNITVALYITKIDISLYNYFDKNSLTKLPDCLKNYTSDLLFPENQRFLTLTWYNLTGYLSSWEFNVISTELSSAVKCSVLDYSFLTEQSFVEPFTCKLEVNLGQSACCNFISRPIQVKFGPSIAHTLAIGSQLWDQTYKMNEKERDFIIMTRFVICNNTNSSVRFGQTSTDEDILLPPKHFHLYSWRSHKKKQMLKVALEENEWVWSKSFTVFEDGMQTIQFNTERNVSMFISVEELSATQKKVTISGQLVISNMLMENFELKVMEAVTENKEAEFKNTPTHIVAGRNLTCSIFINNKKNYFLRLRFYGLESAWTGDIPLREHSAGSQPWLVKVPLQERGQFLSIWCRIVIQDIQKTKRMLAVLWPLFTVRSNLPINSKIHIETPTLNVHLDSFVKGKGELQQLYCPGTIDHSHQLTFQIDKRNSSSNPYVPLNYSLVDQQKFFKKSDKENIDDILAVLGKFGDSKWPYFGEDLDDIDWVVEDQPLTHVQVRYQNACEYSCSLLVELLPWCLTVNNLGVPISVMLNGTELCRIQHHGIVAPPKLEENFSIGLCTGGSWCYSEPLQLAKSDWSQTFYMPKIIGTIPLEGSIKTSVKCDFHICMLSVTSSISNEIRLLKVSSTHVLSNHMSTQVQVICFAVPDRDDIYDFPENIEPYCFTVAPHSHKSNSGISIIQWYTLSKEMDGNVDYALYISFSTQPHLGWSCPLRVDKPFLRKSSCIISSDFPIPVVLTCQEHKGQSFIAIHNDTRPQLFIENKTGTPIFCAQALGMGEVATEAQHFRWHCKIENLSSQFYTMPFLSEKFPELPQSSFSEKIALACDPESDLNDFQWSASVSIIHDNEQFLRIPYFGDIKVTIVNTACTTFLTLDSVSQVEISARDIRVRLSMHENEDSTRLIEKSSEPAAVLTSKLYENEDIPRSLSDTSVLGPIKQPIPRKALLDQIIRASSNHSLDNRSWSDTNLKKLSVKTKSLMVRTIPMEDKWSSVNLNVFVKSISVTFTSDLESEGSERWEIASFITDNIVICASQVENMKVKISASDVQFDNQLYSRESYDFPVVLIGQEVKEVKKLLTLNTPIKVLMERAEENALVMTEFTLETWRDKSNIKCITGIKSLKVTVNPLSCYLEDTYINRLKQYLNVFMPTNLVIWPTRKSTVKFNNSSGSVNVPEIVYWQCAILARPLTIRKIVIEPVSVLLSVHSSVKLYIALDQSPLYFGQFERRRLLTTHYRLGHAMTMHYLSGAIFGAGWVVSSLELLGSPGGLARAMGTGLRDFVSLPYRGLVVGPMAFLRGITQGSASLMKHVTAGTLLSVTKLASSVARNLDRLTLDEEHLKRAEEQRRQRPQGLAQGFMQGLTGLGISLLGAVGGIAHHSLQSVMADGASPRSFVAGVGLGLVGMVTKPLSGAAELVALTGQGLLQGAGWNSLPQQRSAPLVYKIQHGSNSLLKYNWKHIHAMSPSQILYVAEATNISSTSQYESIALILTIDALIIVNLEEDDTQRVISLTDLTVCPNNDPTLLVFKLTPPLVQVKSEDECVAEMDPVSRARVADYVKSTKGLLNLPESENGADHSEIDISPLSSPGATETTSEESTVLTYYVNLQCRNYFLCLMALAKQQRLNYTFPVL